MQYEMIEGCSKRFGGPAAPCGGTAASAVGDGPPNHTVPACPPAWLQEIPFSGLFRDLKNSTVFEASGEQILAEAGAAVEPWRVNCCCR